jgi:hypothetical protein
MKPFVTPRVFEITSARCAACETNSRPRYVPWQQHAVGCSVRLALQQAEVAVRPLRATRAA